MNAQPRHSSVLYLTKSFSQAPTPPSEQLIYTFRKVCIASEKYFITGSMDFSVTEDVYTLCYNPQQHDKTNDSLLCEYQYILKVDDIKGINISHKTIPHPTTYHPYISVKFILAPHVFLKYPTFLFPSKDDSDNLINQLVGNGFLCTKATNALPRMESYSVGKYDLFAFAEPPISLSNNDIFSKSNSQIGFSTPHSVFQRDNKRHCLRRTKSMDLGYASNVTKISRNSLSRQSNAFDNQLLERKHPQTKLLNELDLTEKMTEYELRSSLYVCGAENSVREMLWDICLNGECNELYWISLTIINQLNKINNPFWMKIKSAIAKDIPRTELDNTFIKVDSVLYFRVERLIQAYCATHQDIGFVQGMTDICLLITQVTSNEERAFKLFCKVIDFISPLLNKVTTTSCIKSFELILNVLSPKLHDVIVQSCGGFFFTYQWLLLLFKREFSKENCLRVWDSIFAFPSRKFHLFIGVSILMKYKDIILSSNFAFEQLSLFLKSLEHKIDVDIIYDADINYMTFLNTVDNAIVNKVLGDNTEIVSKQKNSTINDMLKKTTNNTTKDDDFEVTDDILNTVGPKPLIHDLPNNPTASEVDMYWIEKCEYDLWCRKVKIMCSKHKLNVV
ncbi:Rab-GAP TBC domain-containing protein [Entamoeba marina]